MRIAVLTSSRADFGIYLPLLHTLKEDTSVVVDIIAFGTHLSPVHGSTVSSIYEAGFTVFACIETLAEGDSPDAISTSTALTMIRFSGFWKQHQQTFDYILCLGDRYEMFAAVMAGIPFNLRFVHLHAGENTPGAIDDIYRHAITHASSLCFTSTRAACKRVIELTGRPAEVSHVGALSLDTLHSFKPYDRVEFMERWGADLQYPTILFTFHPETIFPSRNESYLTEIIHALNRLKEYQVIITMPNADTAANKVRSMLNHAFSEKARFFLVESLGTRGYFTALAACRMLLGNSSSGIIEAASFKKFVIDLGGRQRGRLSGANVLHTDINEEAIVKRVRQVERSPVYEGANLYWNGGASERIIHVLKSHYAQL